MKNYEEEHLKLVIDNGAECTVLLKKNGKFPLGGPVRLAAFGAGLRYTVKGGTGSGEVNSRVTYTIEQGLEKAGFILTSKAWLDAYDEVRIRAKKQFRKDIKAEAKAKHENPIMYSMGKSMKEPEHELKLSNADETDMASTDSAEAAIYVVSRNSGEGSDREICAGDVLLTASEIRDILALNKMYEKFMLVLNVGGVVDLSPVMEVGNILLLSQLGTDCGQILADILTGKQNPSGKLTTTWAAWDEYSKEGTFGDWNDNRYKEGIYVGYRYFDSFGKKALFPFGHGCSYTEFDYDVMQTENFMNEVSLMIKVKNIGKYPGKEVIQAYLSKPCGRLDQAYQELAGFAKTPLLAPNEETLVTIKFKMADLASYDEKNEAYILEPGDYTIRVGNSSAKTCVATVVCMPETVVVYKTKNCLGKPDFVDIRTEVKEVEATVGELPDVNASVPETCKPESEINIAPIISELTDEELAFLFIGNFDPKAKGLSIIGNASVHLAGAAGETTSQLTAKGIEPLIMADGPAGIRVAREYYNVGNVAIDAHGGGMIPESMLEMMGPILGFIARKVMGGKKIPKDVEIKEHSATMIPIGTAVAQSFNVELAEKFGNMVGTEMELMGVNLWLAPALNIHRSILCGRNFEYYSEDPLVSGLMAAAITKGVQRHKGCGTTIKHYAANNAETNRYCNNSQVSERAMREIYLRGFGICIRNAKPHAVMTSYNLLNGIHTSEHKGLIEDILRNEFEFEGIVMTDWVIGLMSSKKSIYRNALASEVAKNGGDLFMPGGKSDYESVLKALKDGSLPRKNLEISAMRLLNLGKNLGKNLGTGQNCK